ncbi:hypothetical protein SCOR_32435 [Sulfidibacter corallicola]
MWRIEKHPRIYLALGATDMRNYAELAIMWIEQGASI